MKFSLDYKMSIGGEVNWHPPCFLLIFADYTASRFSFPARSNSSVAAMQLRGTWDFFSLSDWKIDKHLWLPGRQRAFNYKHPQKGLNWHLCTRLNPQWLHHTRFGCEHENQFLEISASQVIKPRSQWFSLFFVWRCVWHQIRSLFPLRRQLTFFQPISSMANDKKHQGISFFYPGVFIKSLRFLRFDFMCDRFSFDLRGRQSHKNLWFIMIPHLLLIWFSLLAPQSALERRGINFNGSKW